MLLEKLKASVGHLYPEFKGEVTIAPAKDIGFGDFATPVAFAIAKEMGKSIPDVTTALQSDFEGRLGEGFTVSVTHAFLNITLSAAKWAQIHDLTRLEMGDPTRLALGQKVIVEFISANPTGPLTLANARGGYSGDALCRVLAYAGASVFREYYYNDSGNQIMELGRSIVAARTGEEIEGGYKGEYVQFLANKINQDDVYAAGQAAATYILDTWIKPMIARMGVAFDRFASEQELLDNGLVAQAVTALSERNLVYEHEGALWLRSTSWGDDKDRVLRKGDDTYTYLMKDIAYHWDKMHRGHTVMVTIVGADHYTEAKVLETIITKVIAPIDNWVGQFRQPIIQHVRLVRDGQEVKMSKRAGNFVTIDDLLDEVSTDVARFFFVMRDLNVAMDFDLTLAKEQSDKNPVYYVQYAYVRAKHILEKAEGEDFLITESTLSDDERKLLVTISQFTPTLEKIIETYDIHKLPQYAIDLAQAFHSFYAKQPVLKAQGAERATRLALTKLVFTVLGQSLALIGVSQPDRMVAGDTN